MTYEEARNHLDERSRYGIRPGLDAIRALLHRLGDPQDALRFVHIAGTNGKGSVLALISAALSLAGYRTGAYISPAAFSYNERIQAGGEPISDDDVARLAGRVLTAADAMEAESEGIPTVFEIETAMAFLYFLEKKCDIVVLEAGMGGAMDATNVVRTSVLEVITPIGMDHMQYLGGTIEEIARAKAGIIKPGTLVASFAGEPAAGEIRAACARLGCGLREVREEEIRGISYGLEEQAFSYKQWKNVKISLAGTYQIRNAALALEALAALHELGYDIPDTRIYDGFKRAEWRGRFTVLQKDPLVIMDGAHNVPAAGELRRSLELYLPGRRLIFIMGVFRDKDYRGIIGLTAPLAEHIITVRTPGNPRALTAEELREAVSAVNPSAEAADSIRQAMARALRLAGADGAVIVFGSLSFLGEAERALRESRGSPGLAQR